MASKVIHKLLRSTIGLLLLLQTVAVVSSQDVLGARGGCSAVTVTNLTTTGVRFTAEPTYSANVLASGGAALLPDAEGVLVVPRGASVTINCSAESAPQLGSAVVTWMLDGTPLDEGQLSSSRYNVNRAGDLQIRKVKRKVEGTYRCVVNNNAGSVISRPVHLRMAVLERFTLPEEDTTVSVEQDQVMRLKCAIKGNPAPQVSWERDKEALPQNDRYLSLAGGVLQIRDAAPSDAGTYRCRAESVAGSRRSADITVTITDKQDGSRLPHIIQEVGTQQVFVGQIAVLECAASGSPPITITWRKADGSEVSGPRFSIIGQGNLQVHDVQKTDDGMYVCSVENGVGTVTSQGSLEVLVPPVITNDLENINKPASTTVRFQCEFDGMPHPKVWWTHNGHLIKQEDRYKLMHQGSMLVISQTEVDDSGYIQCWVENKAGLVYKIARLSLHHSPLTPKAPTNLLARRLSSTVVELTWKESPEVHVPGVSFTAYSVHYFPTNGEIPELQKVVLTPATTIKDLTPRTNYTFYVMAYNTCGGSEYSTRVTEVTDEDFPISAPSVSLSAAGATSLQVTWDELEPDEARGTITQYKVIYRKHGSASEIVEHVHGNIREYLLTGLEPNVTYDVRVLAGTAVGFPTLREENWPWVSQITDPNRVKGVPEPVTMRVQVVNSTALVVTWDKVPEMGSKTQGYSLYVTKKGEKNFIKHFLPVPDDTRQLITKLDADTWYELKMLAYNAEGEGKPTIRLVHTNLAGGADATNTGPPPPLSPSVIEAEPLNATAIRVSWRPPPSPNVDKYTIKYEPVMDYAGREGINTSQTRTSMSTSTEILLINLQPYVTYEIAIRSHSGSVFGEYSHEARCKTKEAKPGPPEELQAQVDMDSVVLFWRPPVRPNGNIVHYMIYYTKDPKEHHRHWSTKMVNGSTTVAKISDLSLETAYTFQVIAMTMVGGGPPSNLVTVTPPGSSSEAGIFANIKERDMGIIAGVCIGGGCIIICLIIILMRNRCCPPPPPRATNHHGPYNGNGSLPQGNGNGSIPGYDSYHEYPGMDLMPLTVIDPNDETKKVPQHDTKGGVDYDKRKNGKVNGIHGRNGYTVALHKNGISVPKNGHKVRSSDLDPQAPVRSTLLNQQGNNDHHHICRGDPSLTPPPRTPPTMARCEESDYLLSPDHHPPAPGDGSLEDIDISQHTTPPGTLSSLGRQDVLILPNNSTQDSQQQQHEQQQQQQQQQEKHSVV